MNIPLCSGREGRNIILYLNNKVQKQHHSTKISMNIFSEQGKLSETEMFVLLLYTKNRGRRRLEINISLCSGQEGKNIILYLNNKVQKQHYSTKISMNIFSEQGKLPETEMFVLLLYTKNRGRRRLEMNISLCSGQEGRNIILYLNNNVQKQHYRTKISMNIFSGLTSRSEKLYLFIIYEK